MLTKIEKKEVYQQMTLLMKEIDRLTLIYETWRNYLMDFPNHSFQSFDDLKQAPQLAIETENQLYFQEKKDQSTMIDYQTISIKITSLLKDSGTPKSTKMIFELLTKEAFQNLKYSNLSNNILPKMHKDTRVNVERVHPGYWQYRLKDG